ncbi:Ferrochelatase, protoheme ferro-lyase [Richelia intracellularis HH01]|uniref:coproporphyrin ferrochelatase n=1 Tax=Richelia intracellularis HH01 TaxID=1165094 RepID=M1WYV0_9NOST|nr:ferrochelatase [Richelia intracellularis]CCH66208.1 Ferrochelatase, protoheme ferro-lyase [Richelia intracellularis HH01]HAE06439.1 ferrochelatase [Richelia sp.]
MVAISKTVEKGSEHLSNQDNVAVLLMGYGEVESYNDFASYNEQALNLLTAKFAPVPAWVYPPLAKLLALFDRHEWGHTHHDFISPHNAIFERQRAGIEENLQAKWGNKVKVFKAFNFCAPFLPSQVLAEIKAQGFEKLLIYPLLVVDSIFTSGIAIEQVNQALVNINDGECHWVKSLRYIPSFFNEPDYINLIAQLVEEKINSSLVNNYIPSEIGIILMNHGCPHKAKGFTSGITESQVLYDSVREKLINRYPLISIGWLNHDTPLIEWTQPNVTQAARNLIQLGAKVIIFMPIGFATENHETLLDVDHIIHYLEKQYTEVNYIQMSCVNDNSKFLAMATRWTENHIEALFSTKGITVNASNNNHYHKHDH